MKKYFAYIRVSTQKQGQFGSSLQEQRDAIIAFAKRNELHIVQWFEDRETAAKTGRTQFVRMMSAIERGSAAGIILHKIDRGARNFWDWARLQDLIDAGGELHFVHDNLDLTSRGGRLAADIQAVVAADYIRNLRDEVRKGLSGRLKQGLYPWKAPAGYLDRGGGKPKEIDPIKGPLVRLAFELYSTKQFSYERLAQELHLRGLDLGNGKPLSLKGVTTILRNPFYIGMIRIKKTGEVFQGIHEPLIEARLFEHVQAIIDGRIAVKACKHDFVFRRMLNCGLCGRSLIGELQKGHVYYRCQTSTCPTTTVREEKVRAALRKIAQDVPFKLADYDEMLPYIQAEAIAVAQERSDDLTALKLRISSLEEREGRLTDAYVDQMLDRDSYNARRATVLTELADARDRLKRAGSSEAVDWAQLAKRFLELLKALELGPESGFPGEYRASVETLTSNRVLVGKKLEFSTRFPFRAHECQSVLSTCGPDRRLTRTFDGLRNDKRERARQRQLLIKYLKAPDLAEKLRTSMPPTVRESHPGWFKQKAPPSYDDGHEGQVAA